jgi:prepilin-type N-terminal cleavage/methylation domain-containing protein
MRKKAFTLIELLVVIAIIALLLAIIMPALRRAKLQAQGAYCLFNLKGMARSWHTYAMDNKEMLVNGSALRTVDPPVHTWVEAPENAAGNYPGDNSMTTADEEKVTFPRLLYHYTLEYPALINPASTGMPVENFLLSRSINSSGVRYPSELCGLSVL